MFENKILCLQKHTLSIYDDNTSCLFSAFFFQQYLSHTYYNHSTALFVNIIVTNDTSFV